MPRKNSPQKSAGSLWQPLGVPIFRAVWLGSLFSSIGTMMHQVGSAWLMTSMTSSPVVVGLLQTASTLPMFLVGLPAGVLADLVPRRTMLLITQGWMLLMAATISLATWMNWMTPWLLLSLTFSLGIGLAMSQPSWQAAVQDLAPREMLGAAVSLNSIAFNTARSVGPAIGGILVAAAGPQLVFLLNALSFVGLLLVLANWRPPPREKGPAEAGWEALKNGLRYVWESPNLHAPLIRVAAHMLCASIVMALLPLVAREVWHLDSTGYGLLLAAFGCGSILGAATLPRWRPLLSPDALTGMAALAAAVSLAVLGITQWPLAAGAAMFLWGLSWTGSLVNYNVAMQMGVAAWVRGRAMSIYMLVFMGSMAAGSVCWGWIAGHTSPQTAMLIAAAAMACSPLLIFRWKLAFSAPSEARTDETFSERE